MPCVRLNNIDAAVTPGSSCFLHCRRDSITESSFADLFLWRDGYKQTVIDDFRELLSLSFLRIALNLGSHHEPNEADSLSGHQR